MCIKRFRLVTRSSAACGAKKSSSCFLLTSDAEAPLAQAVFVLSAPAFQSGKGRPISYCLRFAGRMALLLLYRDFPDRTHYGTKEQ